MKIGDVLIPLRTGVQNCVILTTPPPPDKWIVRYESGKSAKWSKRHLKKYYIPKHKIKDFEKWIKNRDQQ